MTDAVDRKCEPQKMEISSNSNGRNATVSPCGTLMCSSIQNSLQIRYTQDPDRSTDVRTRIQTKDILSLQWSGDSTRIAIHSANHIEVIDLDDADFSVRLDNGGGGLGQFTAAEFLDRDHLLTVWEYGRAKGWELRTGKAIEIGEVKTTCAGRSWSCRPSSVGPRTLALLSRTSAEDLLTIWFPTLGKSIRSVKVGTVDAQSLSWSPDGRWLAVQDTPTAGVSVRFFTPDGHPFRSYPATSPADSGGLGVKSLCWSGDSRLLALSKFDGKTVLLNTRTFAPLAIIEHTTTIHQPTLAPEERALVWQEFVSSSNERSYALQQQPISPLISRMKTTTEPAELGVVEASFSRDGAFLATRDTRMLSTVWIWNMARQAAHAVLLQHANVRKLHWHPSRAGLLMLDCGESIACLFDSNSSGAPQSIAVTLPAMPHMSWVATHRLALLATTKAAFCFVYPEGADSVHSANHAAMQHSRVNDSFDEGASEDSILDILSGRKPMPPKTQPSYTEMVDLEVDGEETIGLDDTFREKRKTIIDERTGLEVDPLDDSQIF